MPQTISPPASRPTTASRSTIFILTAIAALTPILSGCAAYPSQRASIQHEIVIVRPSPAPGAPADATLTRAEPERP